MGKVYEAMKKAPGGGNSMGWSSIDLDTAARGASSNGNGKGEGKFDFVNYSLNAPDASEIEQHNKEMAAAQAARKLLVKPSTEVSIDLARIPPQLISFHDPNTNAVEEYNRLAVTLITAASDRPIKRVLLASAQRGEGRTSVMLNLACALARAQEVRDRNRREKGDDRHYNHDLHEGKPRAACFDL